MEHLNSLHLLAGDHVPFPSDYREQERNEAQKIPPGPSGVLQPLLRGCTRKASVPVILIDIILPYQTQNASIVSDSS